MSKVNDGGPAYPVFDSNMGGDLMCTHSGMSLRDWFAGQALMGDWADPNGMIGTTEECAANYYRMADAMIAERSKS